MSSRPLTRTTFVVPQPAAPAAAAPKKGAREPVPFVIVPDAFVIDDDDLEPKWARAIETATD